ncbi:protein brown-like [Pseudomyrmex gracilis]|uniref:protein brown-like n=1 Tax=Pseudomyrmex gracilis TaxID=219809 RepID=UPI000995A925|nr:protein brown-like [Pseudomyrmex gracilis]XP_020287474.1 protein brown-like [Pseudomyrmex gracilis]XP_020287475.1 protein brown-like [Pseudomyrmex gracilis]
MTSELLQLCWENLTVTVSIEDDKCSKKFSSRFSRRKCVKPLDILRKVSGYAEPGNMFAILGPSGAGKTMFLAALARRLKLTSGEVKINGYNVSKETMMEVSSYMPQFDALPSALTPKEYMLFTCALKIGNSCRVSRRKFFGEELLRNLGLHDCGDTVISKLSGGEKKRLSLAAELVTKPKILFLDEPTTGLDTFAATCVAESLKLIASRNTIVFCTIHQPGMSIYSIFSHVILMADGKSVYFGTRERATEFFESQNYRCPANYDESEYYVNILSRRNSTHRDSEQLCQAFSRSLLSKIPAVECAPMFHAASQKKSGWFVQFYWLSWRMFLQSKRTAFDNWIAWFSYSLSIIFISIYFTGIDSSTQNGIQGARGALYMTISEIVFTIVYSVLYELPGELVLYLRENTVYAPGPYYFAVVLGLIPKTTFKALLFTLVMYFILHSEFQLLDVLLYCLCTTTAAVCGTAYGLIMSSWIVDIEILTTVMIPLDLLFLLMAGMFYNLCTLPNYLLYLKYFSIFYYANEAISIAYWSEVKNIDCPVNYSLPCLLNGTEVLTEYGYNEENFWFDITGLLLLTILMNIFGYFGTKRRRTLKSII